MLHNSQQREFFDNWMSMDSGIHVDTFHRVSPLQNEITKYTIENFWLSFVDFVRGNICYRDPRIR